jgi:hypothetical protein
MSYGKTAEEAALLIAKEDYERLPVPEKIKRLEKLLANNIKGMVGDLQILRGNQENLADTMEVNFRGFSKMLARLGLAEEDQKACMDEAEAEFAAERQPETVEAPPAEVTEETLPNVVDQSGDADEPEEATTFGG